MVQAQTNPGPNAAAPGTPPPTAGYADANGSNAAPPPPGAPASPPAAASPTAPPAGYAAQPAQGPPPPAASSQPQSYPDGSYGYGAYEPPPPPPPKEPAKIPSFSIRVDPLNALLNGRMGLELEVQLWRFITFETIPTFVVWEQPPTFNFSFIGRDTSVHQESAGIGALSGASIGIGLWLEGKAFHGYVLRAILTNYAYRYVAEDPTTKEQFDNDVHVERVLKGFFGSLSRIGKVFTIGGGIGLGVDLNREKRCWERDAVGPTNQCDRYDLKLDRNAVLTYNPLSSFYPVYLEGRLSLGVVIDP